MRAYSTPTDSLVVYRKLSELRSEKRNMWNWEKEMEIQAYETSIQFLS